MSPSYKYWAPWIGPLSRGAKILNTEYKKCQHAKDVEEHGTRHQHQMNIEDIIEVLEQGTVSFFVKIC